MGLTTPTLVEEAGKSCHFTAGAVPFQALHSLPPTPTLKKKAPEEICEENTEVAGGAARCGKIYLALPLCHRH